MKGQSVVAEAVKRRAGLRMRQGVVTAVDGTTCTVLIGGSTVPVDGVQHLNSCNPAVDDVVWITSDGADLWIVGTHGASPPIDPSQLPTFATYFAASDTAGAPAAVIGLAGAAAFSRVILSWDLPPEALWRTWEVYEGAAAGFAPVTPVLTTKATVVQLNKATGSGPWYYKVRAINSRGEASADVQVGPFMLPTLANLDLGPGSVYAANMAAGAVDLASAVVTGQILAGKLADNAVTTAKIADGAVTAAEIAASTIVAGNIAAGTITANELNVANVQAAVVTAAKVNTLALSADAITAGTLSAARIAAGSIVAAKLNVADVQAAVVTAAVVNALALNADAITAGTLNVARIAAGSIVAAKLNVADVQAAVVTAAVVNALTLNAISITGGAISGTTITGNTIRTAASGTRVQITGGANDRITWYDAYTSGWMSVYGDAGSSALNIVGPERRSSGITTGCSIQLVSTPSSYPSVKIDANDAILTVGTSAGAVVRIDGNLNVYGRVYPGTNWGSGTSEDGIWIQDKTNLSDRWKVYFDGPAKKLWVRNGSTYYGVVLA